jgi:ketosteroid isomerase-like protein
LRGLTGSVTVGGVAAGTELISGELVQVGEDFYRQFCEGDIRCFDLLDPEVEIETFFGDFRGLDDAVGYFQSTTSFFDDPRPQAEEFVPAGDRVFVLGTWTGTAKSSGASVEARFAHVVWFRGRRISAIHVYVDSAKVLAAIEADGPPQT